MKKEIKNKVVNKITNWNDHLENKYGAKETESRKDFENRALAYYFGELLKEQREKSNLTQAQLAEKTGTKKSYISRVENGHTDIQLSTFYKLIETGMNKKIKLVIA
jgi:ribosome-binding protein aMBF1 (putative translation factor)